LSIEDGTVSYRSGDTLKTAEHITLKLTGDAVSAPLHAEGNLTLLGTALSISADVARLGRAELPLSLTLSSEPVGSAEFTGSLLFEGPKPQAKGKLTLKSTNPAAAAALVGIDAFPAELSKPAHITGDLDAAVGAIALDHVSLELGDIKGDGALRATLGASTAVTAKLTVNAFDVDQFVAERAARAGSGPGKAPQPTAANASLPEKPGPAESERWRLPPGVTATVDLGVDAVTWRKGVMRQVRLEASVEGGKFDITRLGALLPGGTDLAIVGSVDEIAAVPRFVGTVKAAADNLRDLLRWGGVAVEGVPADRLRRATISSRLEVDDRLMEVRALDLTFDASHLTGAATVAMRDRLALGARLTVDQLNLDAYVSGEPAPTAPAPAAPATAPATAGGALTRVTVLQAIADALVRFDANVDASVDTLIWRGQPIRKMRVTGTLENRDLTLRELSVNDLGGAQGKLSGYFQGIGTTEPKTQFAFDMRGPELGRVLRLLSSSVASADTFGAFSLGGEVERQVGRFSLDTDVEVGGGKLHVIGDSPAPDTWALTASLEHPSFNRLMHLATSRYRPQGGELGPVKFEGTMEWSPGSAVMRKFTAAVGGVDVNGAVQIALGGRPMVTATLTLDDLAIDKFMPARQTASLDMPAGPLAPGVVLAQAGAGPLRGASEHWSRAPIELDFLEPFDADVIVVANSLSWASWRIEEPRVKLALKDSVLGVSRLSGRLFGGSLAASGSVEASATPRFRVAAQLAGADFKQALATAGTSRLEGSFDLDASLMAAGANPHELVSHLDGTVSLRGRDGVIDGVNVPAVNQRLAQVKGLGDLASLLKAATSGSTRFSKLEGSFKLADGVARSDDLHLVVEGGDGAGTATVDLPNWILFSRTDVRMVGVPGTPPLGVSLKGPLEQPDWSLDFSAIVRAFANHAVDRLLGPQPGTPEQSGAAQPDTAPGDQPKRLKPKDVLRDLLKSPQ
ncbi:MAG: AsmA family protein, partial [Stellaceae bacterium]